MGEKMKVLSLLLIILTICAFGCDTELGHRHDGHDHENHDHDGDGVQDHSAEDHDGMPGVTSDIHEGCSDYTVEDCPGECVV